MWRKILRSLGVERMPLTMEAWFSSSLITTQSGMRRSRHWRVASLEPKPVGKTSAASLSCQSARLASRLAYSSCEPPILREPPEPAP
ncbi:hypothetical protein D9M68_834260 [compost metagenome]